MATMVYDSVKYGAISGVPPKDDHPPKEVMLQEELKKWNYMLVPMNDNVRYCCDGDYVTYKQYKERLSNPGTEDKYGRMFSCCERKLLTELYGKRVIVQFTLPKSHVTCAWMR